MTIKKLEKNEVFVFGTNRSGFHGAGAAGFAFKDSYKNDWKENLIMQKAIKAPVGHSDRIGKWAVFGIGKGLMIGNEGMSYGIITIEAPGKKRSVSLKFIEEQIEELYSFALSRPDLKFLVTTIGTGLAGFTVDEIKKLFFNVNLKISMPFNIILPEEFSNEHDAAIVVTGGRNFYFLKSAQEALSDVIFYLKEQNVKSITLIEGGALGIDTVCYNAAKNLEKEFDLKIETINADFKNGKSAGPKRNKEMLKRSLSFNKQICLSFPGGKGTLNCTQTAMDMKIETVTVDVKDLNKEDQNFYNQILNNNKLMKANNDGVDHINIYSKAKTELGCYLSNFAKVELILEEGLFYSVEAYWFYLKLKKLYPLDQIEKIKKMNGYEAKKFGGDMLDKQEKDRLYTFEEFYGKIKLAIEQKYEKMPERIVKQLKETHNLPFLHYYVFNHIEVDAGYSWLLFLNDELRKKRLNKA